MSFLPEFKAIIKKSGSGRKLVKSIRLITRSFSKIRVSITLKLVRMMNVNVSLTYDSTRKPDGVGAQLQRILAISGLCRVANLGYVHSGIQDVAVHALDPYRTRSEYREFVDQLNAIFNLESAKSPKVRTEVQIDRFDYGTLLYYSVLSILTGKHFLLRVSEPYSVTDLVASTYSSIHPLQGNLERFMGTFESKSPCIAVHYRWGVGGKQIQKGESSTRELDLAYYLEVIERIRSFNPEIKYNVVIVTDAPEKSLLFAPPIEQRSLWNGSPGFNSDRNTIEVTGINIREHFSNLGMEIEVLSGGSPLDAIAILANSDHLIMSRSSLSFVAGLLSTSEVYFPTSFWHKPLSHWHLVEDYKVIQQ